MTCEVSIGDYFACEDEPYEGPITTILDGDGDEHESLAGDLVRAIVVDVGGSWAAISMPNGAARSDITQHGRAYRLNGEP